MGEQNQADTPVIDYEGSDYRQAFWEGQGREYEDMVERAALRQLMPMSGDRIAEIGAGFGRLADLYTGYKQIILFDYSRTMLADAVSRWGSEDRFIFVAGNVYTLPFASGILDTLVMMRVMHHLADVPTALAQIERSLHGQSVAIIEYANKRNLKAIGRWLLQRQNWSPFALEPVEFVKLNFDFHPVWMAARFAEARLRTERRFALSHFRLPFLKQRMSAETLVGFEQKFFALAGNFPLSPSVFTALRSSQGREKRVGSGDLKSVAALFCCPYCTTDELEQRADDLVVCPDCGRGYQRRNQIWDFKEPILRK
ncbi:MAG: methyltransferase domain-containing protein [Caldilineaceae bacterium]|nr:methyltransferase domain-containing protein [Caldilineaceae bacterium]